jgi:hypothetical protein
VSADEDDGVRIIDRVMHRMNEMLPVGAEKLLRAAQSSQAGSVAV